MNMHIDSNNFNYIIEDVEDQEIEDAYNYIPVNY